MPGKYSKLRSVIQGPERLARNHRHRPAELGVLLQGTLVVVIVGEEIPVLTRRSRARLDPVVRGVPHRSGAVVEQGIAAAAQQPGRRGLQQHLDARNDVVCRAAEIVARRRQIGALDVVQRVREPTEIAGIGQPRDPVALAAGRIAPEHYQIGGAECAGIQLVAQQHRRTGESQPAAAAGLGDRHRGPVPLLHDGRRRIDEPSLRRVLHAHQRRRQELEASVSRDDCRRCVSLRKRNEQRRRCGAEDMADPHCDLVYPSVSVSRKAMTSWISAGVSAG